jgi:hypothetical protein
MRSHFIRRFGRWVSSDDNLSEQRTGCAPLSSLDALSLQLIPVPTKTGHTARKKPDSDEDGSSQVETQEVEQKEVLKMHGKVQLRFREERGHDAASC